MFLLHLFSFSLSINITSSKQAKDMPPLSYDIFKFLSSLKVKNPETILGHKPSSEIQYLGSFSSLCSQLTSYLLGHFKAAIPALILTIIIFFLSIILLILSHFICKPVRSDNPTCCVNNIWLLFFIIFSFSISLFIISFIQFLKFKDEFLSIPSNYVSSPAQNMRNAINNHFSSLLSNMIDIFNKSHIYSPLYMYESSTLISESLKSSLSNILTTLSSISSPSVDPFKFDIQELYDALNDPAITTFFSQPPIKTSYDTVFKLSSLISSVQSTASIADSALKSLSDEANSSTKYFDISTGSLYFKLSIYGTSVLFIISLLIIVLMSCAFIGKGSFSRRFLIFHLIFSIFLSLFIGFLTSINSIISASISDLCQKGVNFPVSYFNAYPSIANGSLHPLTSSAFVDGTISFYDAFNYSSYVNYSDFLYAINFSTFYSSLNEIQPPSDQDKINDLLQYFNSGRSPETLREKSMAALEYLRTNGKIEEADTINAEFSLGIITSFINHSKLLVILSELDSSTNVETEYKDQENLLLGKISDFANAGKMELIDNVSVAPFASAFTTTCYSGGMTFSFLSLFGLFYMISYIGHTIILFASRPRFKDPKCDTSFSGYSSSLSQSSSSSSSSSSYSSRKHRRDRR